MILPINTSSRHNRWRLLFSILWCCAALIPEICLAHQAPNTNILLDVNTKLVAVELQIPIPELALSFKHDILKSPASIVEEYGDQLKDYLKAHIHAYVDKGDPWHAWT